MADNLATSFAANGSNYVSQANRVRDTAQKSRGDGWMSNDAYEIELLREQNLLARANYCATMALLARLDR